MDFYHLTIFEIVFCILNSRNLLQQTRKVIVWRDISRNAAVTTWRIPEMAKGIFLLQAVREPVRRNSFMQKSAISRHFGSKPWKQKERPEKSSCKANIERSIPFRLSICFHCRYSACTYQKFFVQYIIVSILTMKEYFIRSD